MTPLHLAGSNGATVVVVAIVVVGASTVVVVGGEGGDPLGALVVDELAAEVVAVGTWLEGGVLPPLVVDGASGSMSLGSPNVIGVDARVVADFGAATDLLSGIELSDASGAGAEVFESKSSIMSRVSGSSRASVVATFFSAGSAVTEEAPCGRRIPDPVGRTEPISAPATTVPASRQATNPDSTQPERATCVSRRRSSGRGGPQGSSSEGSMGLARLARQVHDASIGFFSLTR